MVGTSYLVVWTLHAKEVILHQAAHSSKFQQLHLIKESPVQMRHDSATNVSTSRLQDGKDFKWRGIVSTRMNDEGCPWEYVCNYNSSHKYIVSGWLWGSVIRAPVAQDGGPCVFASRWLLHTFSQLRIGMKALVQVASVIGCYHELPLGCGKMCVSSRVNRHLFWYMHTLNDISTGHY